MNCDTVYCMLYSRRPPSSSSLACSSPYSDTNSSSFASSIHCCCLEHGSILCTLHWPICVVTSFATSVFNFESLCLLNDTRYVHCVQVLLTVGGILDHMSFTMHIGAEIYAKCVLARQNVFRVLSSGAQSFEKRRMGFVNSV